MKTLVSGSFSRGLSYRAGGTCGSELRTIAFHEKKAYEWVRNNFPQLTLSAPRSGTTAVPTQSVGTRVFGLDLKSGS